VQMFRRALKEAVMDGKEWIGWTTGETQAARYDLSKRIGYVNYRKLDDGDYALLITGPRGGDIPGFEGQRRVSPKKMPELIGKELTEKITTSKSSEGTLEGGDLTVGGEGMKSFYDQILPNEIQKYVKQWGGRVEKAEMPIESWVSVMESRKNQPQGNVRKQAPIWKVEITPEMRDGLKRLDEIEMEITAKSRAVRRQLEPAQ